MVKRRQELKISSEAGCPEGTPWLKQSLQRVAFMICLESGLLPALSFPSLEPVFLIYSWSPFLAHGLFFRKGGQGDMG